MEQIAWNIDDDLEPGLPSPAGVIPVSSAQAAPAGAVKAEPPAGSGQPEAAVPPPPAALLGRAEADRKSGNHARALPLFEEIYRQHPTADVAWRIAICLRKTGRAVDAVRFAADAAMRFPGHTMIVSERAWGVYEAILKPAVDGNRHDEVLAAAAEMIADGADTIVMKVAVFAAMAAARSLGRWDEAIAWCDRLKPAELSAEPRRLDRGRQIPSDRERWYLARAKAALAVGAFADARRIGIEAGRQFPRRPDFARYAAQALQRQGQVGAAREEFEALVRAGRMPWYVWADLASIRLADGDPRAAWEAAIRAALEQGEPKAKVNLFALMADIARRLDRPEDAALHAALAIALRRCEGWAVPQPLGELAAELAVDASASPADLLGWARDIWRPAAESARAAPSAGLLGGTLKKLDPERGIGFIAAGNGAPDIFVKLDDIDPAARTCGCRVTFRTVPSYDHKRQRESVRAVDVVPAAA